MPTKTKKEVKVACQAAATIKLEDIKPFQGDLKELSEPSYQKLRQAILRHGFSFPLFIWKDGKDNYCIDGHQRDKVLRRLRGEGYKIPPLPCAFIQADDEKQAKEKLLMAASVYGEINSAGLRVLVEDAKLDIKELKAELQITELELLDIGDFAKENFESIVDEFSTSKKSMKDGNWFYVEYYGKDKLFGELKALLQMRTEHEIDALFFAALIKRAMKGRKPAAGEKDDKG